MNVADVSELELQELDPITFEVIRHRLWAINDDQARMAARLSGSPIIYDGYDFNAGLTTGDGRGLLCGVYILHHGATLDDFVRKLIADWDPSDINEGDMFFTNDPWWGALHANDGILAMPIFVGGELVAWSGIVLHDDDVGSPVPGSFVTGARDRFGEAPLFPAIRLVRNFEILRDVEGAYLRNSRLPGHNALNMRARVAALRATYRRITELVDEYGLPAFLNAQEGTIRYVERVLRARLRQIPDGSWFAQVYHDHDGNDDEIYRLCCRVTKEDETLTVDMTGTDPQAPGPINCARPAMEGAVLGVVLTSLCFDLPWAIGALRRIVSIVAEEGTINTATSPAAVSMASIMGALSTQDVVAHALAKMLLSSDQYRSEAQATWCAGVSSTRMVTPGLDGTPSLARATDAFGGGGGARCFTDGIDSGGIYHSMGSRTANVETLESRAPILQLFRRELPDGGGAGRFRGGVTLEFAAIAHKAPSGSHTQTRASGVAMPGSRGLSGGLSGSAVSNVLLRNTNVWEMFAAGRVPGSGAEIESDRVDVQQAKDASPAGPADVILGRSASGAGYGDPLLRSATRVLADVRNRMVSAASARYLYGVVVETTDGVPHLDADGTKALRDQRRVERLEQAVSVPAADRPPATGATSRGEGEERTATGGDEPIVIHPVGDTVEAVDDGLGACWIRCSRCQHRFGDYESDYKRAAVMREVPLAAQNPYHHLCADQFVAREFYCPGCGTAIAVDIQDRDEPVLDEVRFGRR